MSKCPVTSSRWQKRPLRCVAVSQVWVRLWPRWSPWACSPSRARGHWAPERCLRNLLRGKNNINVFAKLMKCYGFCSCEFKPGMFKSVIDARRHFGSFISNAGKQRIYMIHCTYTRGLCILLSNARNVVFLFHQRNESPRLPFRRFISFQASSNSPPPRSPFVFVSPTGLTVRQ